MRLFYALEVPGELAVAIADWRQQQLPPAGREVPLANFHITLAFLGEVAENRLEQLCTDTEHRLGTSALGPNQIPLDQLGFWPGQKPRRQKKPPFFRDVCVLESRICNVAER